MTTRVDRLKGKGDPEKAELAKKVSELEQKNKIWILPLLFLAVDNAMSFVILTTMFCKFADIFCIFTALS